LIDVTFYFIISIIILTDRPLNGNSYLRRLYSFSIYNIAPHIV